MQPIGLVDNLVQNLFAMDDLMIDVELFVTLFVYCEHCMAIAFVGKNKFIPILPYLTSW